MCGIIGFSVCGDCPSIEGQTFVQSLRSLAHRGPDSSGAIGIRADNCFHENIIPDDDYRFGLGHTRLAVLDLSDKGSQPFRDAHGNYIVLNGEIFNFVELRNELAKSGHEFFTETDTEVVLAAYREYGADCVKRFNGMWAFALFDRNRNELFISRDRLGIKPFYYIRRPSLFAFASEIHALLSLTKTPAQVALDRLGNALVHGIADSVEQTMYPDVSQLPAGHNAFLNLRNNDWTCRRYWGLPDDDDLDLSDKDALDRFEFLLEDAVRLRFRADVPVAITLSGGVDSSAVSLAASRVQGADVPVFTSSFPRNPEIDETRYARDVSDRCGLASHLIEPDISRVLDEEPLLCKHQELLFVSLSLYVHWAILSRIKRDGLKVVLSGQGGDELFLGYERYFASKVLQSFPNVIQMLRDFYLCGKHSRLGLGGMAAFQLYFMCGRLQRARRMNRFHGALRPHVLADVSRSPQTVFRNLRALYKHELLGEELSSLLRYDDRTAGAHGMETRLPFLDYRMVEFAVRLPIRFKIRDGWSKWITRMYLDRHGLKTVAWRRAKLAFNAPTVEWTCKLWEKYGEGLCDRDISRQLLSDTFDRIPCRKRSWEIYNLLELAQMMNWSRLV